MSPSDWRRPHRVLRTLFLCADRIWALNAPPSPTMQIWTKFAFWTRSLAVSDLSARRSLPIFSPFAWWIESATCTPDVSCQLSVSLFLCANFSFLWIGVSELLRWSYIGVRGSLRRYEILQLTFCKTVAYVRSVGEWYYAATRRLYIFHTCFDRSTLLVMAPAEVQKFNEESTFMISCLIKLY